MEIILFNKSLKYERHNHLWQYVINDVNILAFTIDNTLLDLFLQLKKGYYVSWDILSNYFPHFTNRDFIKVIDGIKKNDS